MPKPIVASYCADFLKADMQHIHRQICDLREWEACVITHHRENETLFPWPRKKIRVLPKHRLRFFRRLWHRQLCHRIVPPTLGETKQFLYQVYRFNAREHSGARDLRTVTLEQVMDAVCRSKVASGAIFATGMEIGAAIWCYRWPGATASNSERQRTKT